MKIKLILLLLFFWINLGGKIEKKNSYPNIVWWFEIYDKETKKIIPDVVCYQEIYYEFVECQTDLSTQLMIRSCEVLLKDEKIDKLQKEEILKEYEDLKLKLIEEKELNKFCFYDTIYIKGIENKSYMKPFKKYKIRLVHHEYETIEIVDSFPECEMNIVTKVGLTKKE